MTVLDAGAVYQCAETATCPVCSLSPRGGQSREAWAERVRALARKRLGGSPTLNGRWTRHWSACRECGRTDRVHSGQGYCARCYSAARRRRMAS